MITSRTNHNSIENSVATLNLNSAFTMSSSRVADGEMCSTPYKITAVAGWRRRVLSGINALTYPGFTPAFRLPAFSAIVCGVSKLSDA